MEHEGIYHKFSDLISDIGDRIITNVIDSIKDLNKKERENALKNVDSDTLIKLYDKAKEMRIVRICNSVREIIKARLTF